MPTLQCKSRSNSNSCSQKNLGAVGRAFAESDYYKDAISQANTVPIKSIFTFYKVKFPNNYNKTFCPFPDHVERTPSFVLYKDTNSFYCYGCSYGTRCTDFVAKIESLTKQEAAKKILLMFEGQTENSIELFQDNMDRLEILNEFSESVLNFKKSFFDKKSREFVEHICQTYDDFNDKKSLNNDALVTLTNLLKLKLKRYKV